ncbi:MAG: hypothetical protein ACLRFL_00125 [Clostridia bacterium]
MRKNIVKKALRSLTMALLPIVLSTSLTLSFIPKDVNEQSDFIVDDKYELPEIDNDNNISEEESKSEADAESKKEETEEEIMDNDYASMEQIYSLMEEVGADNSYFRTYQNFANINKQDVFNILNHNNGEPIYVEIPEDYSERTRTLIKCSLDKVFGIVSQINDNYTYQIVDSAPKDKCFIKYKAMEIPTNGYAWYDFNYNTIRNRNGVITINQKIINNSERENDLLYTLTHELLHLFGFLDIYNAEGSKFHGQDYSNSFMKSTYFLATSENFIPITPNDYKLLLSAYALPTNNEQEFDQTLEQIKNLVKNYEKEYYAKSINEVKGKMKNYEAVSFENEFVIGFKDFLNCGNNMAVKVKGQSYSLFIIEDNGNKTKVHEGKVYNINDGVVLQDIKLENAYKNNTGGVLFSGDLFLCCGVGDENVKIFATDYSKSESIHLKAEALFGFDHLVESTLEC